MADRPIRIHRSELTKVFSNPRDIQSFEEQQDVVAGAPDLILQAQTTANDAQTKVNALKSTPSWLVLSLSTLLTNERRLTAGSGITLSDGGANADAALTLSTIADQRLLANFTGATAVPIATTLSAAMDGALGNTRGQVVFRGATAWTVLAAGTAGYLLSTNGAGADPSWVAAGGGAPGPAGPGAISQPMGRLTLTGNTPIMTADATAQASVYYAPYIGTYYPVYSGSTWSMLAFSQLTMALDTSNQLLENLYDLFVYSASGTPAIGAGPAWSNTATITVTIATPAVVTWTAHGLPEGAPVVFTTTGALPTGLAAGTTYYVTKSPSTNSFSLSTSVANAAAGTKVATSGSQSGTHTGTNHTTVRGTGAGTTELELKDGIWTNKNSITLKNGAGAGTAGIAANTATYVGTVYCTANGQTGVALLPAGANGGTSNIIGLFNAYNRVRHRALGRDTTSSWTVSNTVWRLANGAVGNRISYVDGLAQVPIRAFRSQIYTTTSAGYVGATRNNTDGVPQVVGQAGATANATAEDAWYPLLGFNYISAMENGTGTSTGYGTSGAASAPSGFGFQVEGDF